MHFTKTNYIFYFFNEVSVSPLSKAYLRIPSSALNVHSSLAHLNITLNTGIKHSDTSVRLHHIPYINKAQCHLKDSVQSTLKWKDGNVN